MNNLKDNLLNPNTWLRLVLVCIFFVVRWVLLVVVNLVIAAQFIFVLISAEKNEELDRVAVSLAAYLLQIVEYQSFVSDVEPWPLSAFPESIPTIAMPESDRDIS